jgi:hypothetical protein
MKNTPYLFPLTLLVLTVSALAWAQSPVAYPEGYKDWRLVKSMILLPGHPLYEAFGGLHYVYANPKAVTGYKTNHFPNGSVIVFDLVEAKTEGNAITDGPRKVVGVMVKDSARYSATGGWGFEGFKGDSKTDRAVGSNAKTACFACHEAQKETDFVFSKLRD